MHTHTHTPPAPAQGASVVAQMVKASACNTEALGSIPGWERSSGEGNATHCNSNILAWKTP